MLTLHQRLVFHIFILLVEKKILLITSSKVKFGVCFCLQCFRDLTFLSRDSLNVVVEHLIQIAADKYQKLTDVSRSQLIWVTK